MTGNKKNIALFGSCLVKDPFTTFFNKDYKKFYDVKIMDQKHSLISILQEKVSVDESLLDIFPKNPANNFQSRCLKEDFNKSFINQMKSTNIDYLIMDIFFEIGHGILCYDGNIITNDSNLRKAKFFDTLDDFKELTLINNSEEYFKIWTKYCDEFFRFLEIYCPNTKVILAQAWAETKVMKSDGTIYEDNVFIQRANSHNPLYEKLENYILNHFDVYYLAVDKDNIICNEDHVWGKFYVHYTNDYYVRFYEKVGEIIHYDELRKKYESNFVRKHLHNSRDIWGLDEALSMKSPIVHSHDEFSKNQLKSLQKIMLGEGIYNNISFNYFDSDVDNSHLIVINNIRVQDDSNNYIDIDYSKLTVHCEDKYIPNNVLNNFLVDYGTYGIPTDYFGGGIHNLCLKYDETFSDEIEIYVKDENNMFDYDTWLGSSFSKDMKSFDKFQVQSIVSSNEWADIGDRSVKVVCDGEKNYQALVTKLQKINKNDSISAQVTIYNPEADVTVRLFEPTAASFKDIVVRQSNTPNRVNITKMALTDKMQLLLISRVKQTFYADNFVFSKI